ncbi:hypothetical protein PILCRDRAFT_817208 [Piloderma croceum F 1598]|uniref:TECPR1-like DysF domain-containing protein n=1 Tax=Piloderma croceum (strain F 1598) TaxID=765440 RepID=A0A0C3FZR4_PILCF|nr:hypothetical protein PILCRDRAFT_817208 [Piloderma croceum F 1598]
MAASSLSFPPPQCMQTDEYSAADAARRRLAPKSGLRLFASLTSLRQRSKSTSSKRSSTASAELTESTGGTAHLHPPTDTDDVLINLDGSAISDFHENKDVYKWAILYENQRGFTMFSTPYYSSLSLLPHDPLPFTIPSTSSKRSQQPEVSLTEYPLPDGTWRWISKSWMIDMRTDSGEVQYDGFEYNWRFRRGKWTANVGKLSSGGWVRRRRWVRLMMRPARTVGGICGAESNSSESPHPGKSIHSSFGSPSEFTNDAADLDAGDVWKGDDVEQDWMRCHMIMKRLGRDGRKLELWKRWLGGYYSEHAQLGQLLGKGKQKQRQWTDDSRPLPSEVERVNRGLRIVTDGASPELEYVAAVLRIHGDVLLHSFIFPDSRAQFLELLGQCGLLPEMNVGIGIGWTTTDIDFWSYASGLERKVVEDDMNLKAKEREEEELKVNVDKSTEVRAVPQGSGDNDVD